MATDSARTPTPDLSGGVAADSVPDGGTLLGHVGEDDVLLVRQGDRVFAVGAYCTHYHGRLADGLVVGDTVRCPLHHACFSLQTGDAVRAPALDPIACWRVERHGDTVSVREKLTPQPAPRNPGSNDPSSIVIVGGGAAGLAAADMLRREGYGAPVTIISADSDSPVDRPNLSKDFLAGEAKDDWIPLWPSDLFAERRIELVLGTRVAAIDTTARTVLLEKRIATCVWRAAARHRRRAGSDPDCRRGTRTGVLSAHVCRQPRDRRTRRQRQPRRRRRRQLHRVGSGRVPPHARYIRGRRGAGAAAARADHGRRDWSLRPVDPRSARRRLSFAADDRVDVGRTVTLSGGTTLEADFVVMGVGVRPAIGLAEQAGLAIDRGIAVNEFLETSVNGIFAAGDAARWPDPHTGQRIRVEHWVVAERQGQVAARNMLGRRERFDAVPFFWSQHYDVTIRYIGHAEKWTRFVSTARSTHTMPPSVLSVADARLPWRPCHAIARTSTLRSNSNEETPQRA
jgi:nitrite reductase/ring-hydroxylating ferredoxin subunit